MEQNTKTILWVVAFITLPITIPLAIISAGIILSMFWVVLCIFLAFAKEILTAGAIVVVVYIIYKWLSRNG